MENRYGDDSHAQLCSFVRLKLGIKLKARSCRNRSNSLPFLRQKIEELTAGSDEKKLMRCKSESLMNFVTSLRRPAADFVELEHQCHLQLVFEDPLFLGSKGCWHQWKDALCSCQRKCDSHHVWLWQLSSSCEGLPVASTTHCGIASSWDTLSFQDFFCKSFDFKTTHSKDEVTGKNVLVWVLFEIKRSSENILKLKK